MIARYYSKCAKTGAAAHRGNKPNLTVPGAEQENTMIKFLAQATLAATLIGGPLAYYFIFVMTS